MSDERPLSEVLAEISRNLKDRPLHLAVVEAYREMGEEVERRLEAMQAQINHLERSIGADSSVRLALRRRIEALENKEPK